MSARVVSLAAFRDARDQERWDRRRTLADVQREAAQFPHGHPRRIHLIRESTEIVEASLRDARPTPDGAA